MWRPIQKCMMCGSTDLEIDEENKYAKCHNCGTSVGGANFWQDPNEM